MVFESQKQQLIGLTLVGVLAGTSLVACSPADSSPTGEPTSPASESSSSAPAPTESGSPSASPSESAGPASVVSPAPETDDEAKDKAFEAVQAQYEVVNRALQANRLEEATLATTTAEPLYGQLVEALEPLEDSTQTQKGGSVPRLLEAIPGKLVVEDTEYPHASVGVSVCEDNTRVKVTDEKGNPVSSGDRLRYEVDYSVQWSPEDETWRVSRREVPENSDGEARQC